jgi:fatty-acyl-CoA synthase
MPSETIQQLLRERATSDAIAVKHGDRQWTWREHMRDASVRAAALLTLVDPDRPAHVGVLLGNTPEFLNQMAAAGLGGYVLCGLNTTRRGAALAADIRKADCQVVVTASTCQACGCSTAPARTGRAYWNPPGSCRPIARLSRWTRTC